MEYICWGKVDVTCSFSKKPKNKIIISSFSHIIPKVGSKSSYSQNGRSECPSFEKSSQSGDVHNSSKKREQANDHYHLLSNDNYNEEEEEKNIGQFDNHQQHPDSISGNQNHQQRKDQKVGFTLVGRERDLILEVPYDTSHPDSILLAKMKRNKWILCLQSLLQLNSSRHESRVNQGYFEEEDERNEGLNEMNGDNDGETIGRPMNDEDVSWIFESSSPNLREEKEEVVIQNRMEYSSSSPMTGLVSPLELPSSQLEEESGNVEESGLNINQRRNPYQPSTFSNSKTTANRYQQHQTHQQQQQSIIPVHHHQEEEVLLGGGWDSLKGEKKPKEEEEEESEDVEKLNNLFNYSILASNSSLPLSPPPPPSIMNQPPSLSTTNSTTTTFSSLSNHNHMDNRTSKSIES